MSKENEIEIMNFTEKGQRWLQCKSCYEYQMVEEKQSPSLVQMYNDRNFKETNG